MNKILATSFASLGFILVLAKLIYCSWETGSFDSLYFLEMSIFSAAVFGLIGYYLGKVMDLSEKTDGVQDVFGNKKDDELLIDDVLIYDIGVKHKKEDKKEENPEVK